MTLDQKRHQRDAIVKLRLSTQPLNMMDPNTTLASLAQQGQKYVTGMVELGVADQAAAAADLAAVRDDDPSSPLARPLRGSLLISYRAAQEAAQVVDGRLRACKHAAMASEDGARRQQQRGQALRAKRDAARHHEGELTRRAQAVRAEIGRHSKELEGMEHEYDKVVTAVDWGR